MNQIAPRRSIFPRDADGQLVTPANLPPANTRWTKRRKMIVVVAVRGGLLSLEAALERYRLSVEEFREWSRSEGPSQPRSRKRKALVTRLQSLVQRGSAASEAARIFTDRDGVDT